MLVLTRRVGESIRINENIAITVMEVDGKSVKLAIEAPRSVSIHREEIFQRIQEENKRAATDTEKKDLSKVADMFKKK